MKAWGIALRFRSALMVPAIACLLTLPAAASAEGTFQRTLQVTGAVNLDVSTGSGNVEVYTGSGNTVGITGFIKVTSWFDGSAEEKVRRIESNPPIEQNGNTIRIGHIEDSELRRNISISYKVSVPAQTQLKSHTGSGNQSVDGIAGPAEIGSGSGSLKVSNVGGMVRADTGSGNVDIDHIKGNVHAKAGSGSIHANDVGGGFDADTGSGHISLEQSAPGAVNVETGSGGMELHGLRGSLEAKTGSGTITADGDPQGAWTVRTGSGSIRLRLPQNASFDLAAHTSSGSISVDQPVTVQGSIGRKEVHGKVRGGGVPVDVETGSGSIDIQ
jgi:DUF4097 and DUF4098 domain-containing protein YvlB